MSGYLSTVESSEMDTDCGFFFLFLALETGRADVHSELLRVGREPDVA